MNGPWQGLVLDAIKAGTHEKRDRVKRQEARKQGGDCHALLLQPSRNLARVPAE